MCHRLLCHILRTWPRNTHFLNHFGLGHIDEPKFHEFGVLLTSLDSQRVPLHVLYPENYLTDSK